MSLGVGSMGSGSREVEIRSDNSPNDRRRKLAVWVAQHVLPHEAKVRAWLVRRVAADEADEVLQDAYCRIVMLEDVSHIDRPDAYFFSVARNLLLRRLKRQQIVPIEMIAEIDAFQDDIRPSPEKIAGDRQEYDRVVALIDTLPERCRQIVRLRKIEGWSQKRIAEHLGTTEKAVEKQVWSGVKAVKAALSGDNPSLLTGKFRRERRQ